MTRYPLNVYITGVGGLGLAGFSMITVAASLLGRPGIMHVSVLVEHIFAMIGLVGVVIAAVRYYTGLLGRDSRAGDET